MIPKKVLVFPAGSEIGLEVFRAVSDSIHFELIGAGSTDDHAAFVYPTYINTLPYLTAPDFIEQLAAVCREHAIDLIYPAHDSALTLFSANQHLLPATVVGSSAETTQLCRHKSQTYRALQGIIPVPEMYTPETIPTYPVFLKPDAGQGSKGTALVKSPEELTHHLATDPALLILENLPGPEYTIDCFTDHTGALRFAAGRVRNRISNGISVSARAVENPAFRTYAEKINAAIKLRGAWFFQLKERASGELALLEVAPRIAGTSGYQRVRGINLPLLSLYDAQNLPTEVSPNGYSVVMDRALGNRYKTDLRYTHLYIDLDDTLIHRGQVHTGALSLVYQCRNRGGQVHLVTRHKGDLEQTLHTHALSSCFKSVFHLRSGELKSSVMQHPDAIFVDDSFRERADVRETLGIPVFGLDSIEMLLQ